MDDSTLPPDVSRDRNGRFRKGRSGNPAGRPPGILNEATRTAAMLLGGEAGALTRAAIELALSGNLAALRLCLDRIIAPQREQPAAFTFLENGDPGDVDAAMAALTRAAASGEVTPHAAALADMLEACARVGELTARQVASRHPEIQHRMDLRVCVLLEFHARYFHAVGVLLDEEPLERRGAELLRLGANARQLLAMIPDTPALMEADSAFLDAHPLPLERQPAHPLVTEMHEANKSLLDWLDRPGRLDEIDQRLAAFFAEHLDIHDPTDPEEEKARVQLLRERHLILA